MVPFAEMNSNGKGLDEGTGVHRMMTLQSKQLFIFIILILNFNNNEVQIRIFIQESHVFNWQLLIICSF